MEYNIGEYNLYNIKFVKDKKNYRIYHKNKLVTISTPFMYIPFGIENYKYKNILNIEFKDNNNDIHNLCAIIKQIDKFFRKLSYDDNLTYLKVNVKNKRYISCMRYKIKPLLRTHLKKQTIICDKDNKYVKNIKGKSGKFVLHMGTLWVTKDSYGLIWYVDKCII